MKHLMILATCAACLSIDAAASEQDGLPILQAPWRAFDLGDFPEFAPVAISLGDVDNDGINDIVAARRFFSGPGISVVRGRENGSFAPEEIYTLPFSHDLGDCAFIDIDDDGHLDVVASVPGNAGTDQRIVLWRNDSTGAFGTPQFFLAGPGPIGITVADFNSDGFPDVVTADNGYVAGDNDTISLMLHNGLKSENAGFLPPHSFTIGDDCQRTTAGDLDLDGDIDLVVGRDNSAGQAVVFNDGSGNFSAPVFYDQLPGGDTRSPATTLADMDNDGDLDLLGGGAVNGIPNYGIITIRHNDGNGGFGALETLQIVDWTWTPHTIHTDDLNADGWRDIIVSTPSGRANDGFNVLLSDGEGGYQNAARYEAGKQTFDIVTSDVDNDGDQDIITLANDSSVITVHLNLGNGTFHVPTRNFVGVLTRDMVQGDIDNDGDADLVTGGDSDVHFLRNNGDATFPTPQPFDTPFAPGDILLADMNNDGWLDLVLRSYDFAVALNDGEGQFYPAVVTFVGATQAGEVGAFDLDNDGDLDIVCTDPGPASRVYLFSNNGNGTSFNFENVIADFDGLPFGIGGADLNHDGNVDLIFNNALGLTLYLGNGDFSVSDPFPTADYGYPFILRDINGDDEPDLSYKRPEPSFGTTEVATMIGYGDGSFGFPNILPGPNGLEGPFRVTSDVDVADVNGDGLLDVLFTNNAPNDLCIFPGLGDGHLSNQDRYGAGYSASDSAVADFDGDGLNDVATVISLPPSGLADAVVILRNITENQNNTQDINGDGVVDVTDLLALLAAWGNCNQCPEDINNDGAVNVDDILLLLAAWS